VPRMLIDDSAAVVLGLAWAQLPPLPAQAPLLFLGARSSAWLPAVAQPAWQYAQDFKPHADALQAQGCSVTPVPDGARHARVLLLPPRQRQAARALLARAVAHCAEDAQVLLAAANDEGARSLQNDLAALAGPVSTLSKHHCRAVWTAPLRAAHIDQALCAEWRALDAPRDNPAGYCSRPGLFAWDRIDPGSQLLAAQLPAALGGAVADLGAGWGYLSSQLLQRCAGITELDLYEADARALEPARVNLARIAHPARVALHWHDVSQGLPRRYDAIISNPPFHIDRADRPQLGQAFIAVAAAALHAHGQLWLVANQHLPYEAALTAHFAQVEVIAQAQGYKVLRASGPRA